jgi:DNA-binding NarL/FixJ family response regulator
VILLDKDEERMVITAFRLGAKGIFCPIQSDFTMLCRCVERVYEGQIWANSSQMGYAMEALTQLAPLPTVGSGRLKLLTKRERDVAWLLVEGFTNRDIARELKLSEHTVKNHIFHIFDKLGVSNRVELVLYATSGAKAVQVVPIDGAKGQTKDSQVSNGSPLSMSAAVGKR